MPQFASQHLYLRLTAHPFFRHQNHLIEPVQYQARCRKTIKCGASKNHPLIYNDRLLDQKNHHLKDQLWPLHQKKYQLAYQCIIGVALSHRLDPDRPTPPLGRVDKGQCYMLLNSIRTVPNRAAGISAAMTLARNEPTLLPSVGVCSVLWVVHWPLCGASTNLPRFRLYPQTNEGAATVEPTKLELGSVTASRVKLIGLHARALKSQRA